MTETDKTVIAEAAPKQSLPTVRCLSDFSQVAQLYRTRLKKDFARNERKPLSAIRQAWDRGTYDCYGLFREDEIVGYASFVRLGTCYLLDYFAITEAHRDEGLGSFFLHCLADCLSDADCILVEVEDPQEAKNESVRAIRERRLQFYLRNGCRKTGVTSVLFGVPYCILDLSDPIPAPETIQTIYTDLYRSILPRVFFTTQFRTECAWEQAASCSE